MIDINTCPKCGGIADNGHDRCLPPSPYYCTKCTEIENMTDKIRERFEAWCESEGINPARQPGQDAYVSSYIAGAWDAYKAAHEEAKELVVELVNVLQKIASRPDLPNPDRYADWKNCMKNSAYEAKKLLTKAQNYLTKGE